MLAERVDELLDEALRRSGGDASDPGGRPQSLDDQAPLDQPIDEEFRAGTITLVVGRRRDDRVVIEVFPIAEDAGSERRGRRSGRVRGRRAVVETEAEEVVAGRSSSRIRPVVRPARPAGRRGGPPDLPVLRRADGPRRPHLPACQRLQAKPLPEVGSPSVRDPRRRAGAGTASSRSCSTAPSSSTGRLIDASNATFLGAVTLDGVGLAVRLQAGRGGAAALGLPGRHAGGPGARRVAASPRARAGTSFH